MTDKQIIIDGVNVKDCKRRIGKDNYCRYYKRPCSENNYNCIWKKYLRKEQECEELKKQLERKEENYQKLLSKSNKYIHNLVDENVQDISNLGRQLDQLKEENDKYSLFIEKLCDYAGLECDSEEQAMRTLSDLASQMNKARWIIDRYKQTLTEIKEMLKEICMEECSFDWNKTSKKHCGDCDCRYGQILQKIRECEVENDR